MSGQGWEAFLVDDREHVLSIYVEFDRSVGAEYVAYAAEVAFGQVYVDFGFAGPFSFSFREFLGFDCFFWAR